MEQKTEYVVCCKNRRCGYDSVCKEDGKIKVFPDIKSAEEYAEK